MSRLESTLRFVIRDFWITTAALVGLSAGAGAIYVGHSASVGDGMWLVTLGGTGFVLVAGTVRKLVRGELSADVIASVAIVAALVLDQPFAGLVIVVMQSGGEGLERYAYHRATSSLERLVRRAPQSAYVRHGAALDRVPVDTIRPGDRLVVRSGDIVPVDGTISDGVAVLDESAITGESLPVTRGLDRTVLSGGVNVGPPFDLLALRPSQESQYVRMVGLVRRAQSRKPPIQRVADRYAAWFTPLTFVVAALAAVLDHNLTTGLAVLVVATPCPLIVAVPIAVVRGIDRAAERGMILKNGGALEELGRARVVYFDKTGTLTRGRPEITRIIPADHVAPNDLLLCAGAVERYSAHPLGAAFVRALEGRAVPAATEVREFPGAGVSGLVEGRRVLVGSPELCRSAVKGSAGPFLARIESDPANRGRLVALVVADGEVQGAVLFADPVRNGLGDLPARLKALGIEEVGLLTGDNPGNAREVAVELGIDRYDASLSPERKVEIVGLSRQRVGPTVMVGDGINDAAALATASVGVAMAGEGAGISAEAADVVLISNDPATVVEGISIGQTMLRIARQGIWFGLGASLVLMAIAGVGFIAPAVGAGLQEVIDVTVIVNALRVR